MKSTRDDVPTTSQGCFWQQAPATSRPKTPNSHQLQAAEQQQTQQCALARERNGWCRHEWRAHNEPGLFQTAGLRSEANEDATQQPATSWGRRSDCRYDALTHDKLAYDRRLAL